MEPNDTVTNLPLEHNSIEKTNTSVDDSLMVVVNKKKRKRDDLDSSIVHNSSRSSRFGWRTRPNTYGRVVRGRYFRRNSGVLRAMIVPKQRSTRLQFSYNHTFNDQCSTANSEGASSSTDDDIEQGDHTLIEDLKQPFMILRI
jgi:hypothetical protein